MEVLVNIFEKKNIVYILLAILRQTDGFMDHSLLVMGRIIENMAGGREILNILLHKKIMWRSCKSKVYLQPCEFAFFGGEGLG